MSYSSGRHHIGRRGVEEIVETVFEVPTSLGSVSALEGETSAALASPYQEAQAAVREAPVKNTDETSWKEKGDKRWLWSAATATVALFVIHLRRNFAGLQALLGGASASAKDFHEIRAVSPGEWLESLPGSARGY